MPKIVLGLVGPIASGKSTIVDILKKKGFSAYSLSDRIREEITSRGLEITRNSLNEISNELRETKGANILAKRTIDLIKNDANSNIVIDSIRNPSEIKALREAFEIKIIGVTAPQEKRFELFQARGVNIAGINTWEEFKALDDRESEQNGENKQQVNACLALANTHIVNSGTIADLERKIEELLA